MAERACGTCFWRVPTYSGERGTWYHVCEAPLPMWADDGDRGVVTLAQDATHCDAYREVQDIG